MLTVAMITTDARGSLVPADLPEPVFGPAPEALLQGFAELPGVAVHVLSCTQEPVRAPEKLFANVFYHNLHVPTTGWLRTGYQGCIRAVRKKLSQIKPHLVHGQGTERDCAISAVFSGHPSTVTMHGNMAEIARLFGPRPFTYLWLAARLETFTLQRTIGVFCNSGYTEALVKPRAPRTWRVANPIRRRFFEAAPGATAVRPSKADSAACVITNIGVISPRKRQLELLEVLGRLQQRGLQFRVDFVGASDNGPYSKRFFERAKSLGPCVRHLGLLSSEEVIEQLDASSGLIHFPLEEAFGLVVCEALARGLKLFGSRTGGIPDIAHALPGAELFDVDDWSGLERSIAAWISSGSQRPTGSAIIMRERYHPSVIAQRHVEIYREVLRIVS